MNHKTDLDDPVIAVYPAPCPRCGERTAVEFYRMDCLFPVADPDEESWEYRPAFLVTNCKGCGCEFRVGIQVPMKKF